MRPSPRTTCADPAFRPIVPLIKAIASSVTIGSGGAAGREGPAAQISSGTPLRCSGDLLRVPAAERRLLVLSGMAAGLSAIFRAPLGMAIFAGEVLYGGLAFEYEALPYTLIAAVVAYAVNGLFVGWDTLFAIPAGLNFVRPVELAGYAVLGVAAGAVGCDRAHDLLRDARCLLPGSGFPGISSRPSEGS